VRLKKRCTGYRDVNGFLFRHADLQTEEKGRKPGKKNRKKLSIDGSGSAQNYSAIHLGKQIQFLAGGMSRVLLPSQDDLPICFFYQTTLESLINADRALYLHLQLPMLFSRSDAGSALHLATQAISLAVWSRSRLGDISARHLSRKRYVQALVAMNAAIRDKVEVKSDETLYAVLLLSGYEVCLRQLLSRSSTVYLRVLIV